MTTAFQPNAFQFSAFQVDNADLRSGGGGISGGTFSRGRWHKLRTEWDAEDAADRKRNARIEASKKAAAEAKAAQEADALTQRRLDEDLQWGLRRTMAGQLSAHAAQAAAAHVAEQLRQASIHDAAARAAHRKILDDQEEEAAIERLLLES